LRRPLVTLVPGAGFTAGLGRVSKKSKAAVTRLRLRSRAEGRPHERGDSRMDRPGRIVTRLSNLAFLRGAACAGHACGPDGPLR
jgi:hypothetical protein